MLHPGSIEDVIENVHDMLEPDLPRIGHEVSIWSQVSSCQVNISTKHIYLSKVRGTYQGSYHLCLTILGVHPVNIIPRVEPVLGH